MKLQLLSDLHLEANPDFVPTPAPGADLLVLAGDVGSYQLRREGSVMDEADWGLQRFANWPVPVLFVPGNHEYDALDVDVAHERLRATCERLGLLWLERETRVLQGVRFVGTTLWSDLPAGERRLAGVRVLEVATPAEEAQGIALALRQALEEPGRTAALVTPDRALAKRVETLLAIVDKRRERPGESEVMNVIGDIEGKACFLIDDIIDSGGTLCNAAEALLGKGATSVTAYITHGVLSGGAVARVASSKLKELVITDSIQPTQEVLSAPNIRVISTDTLIGEAINRTAAEQSVSSLFD